MKERKIKISSKNIIDLEINVENRFSNDENLWNNSIAKILGEIIQNQKINLIVEKPRKTSVVYSLSDTYNYNKSSKILISKINLDKKNIVQIVKDEDFKLGTLRILISSRDVVNKSLFDYMNYPDILEEEVLIYCNGDGNILTLINSPLSNTKIIEILNLEELS